MTGLTLGLAAGVSPGPLLALLVAQTMRYGVREGAKVALAPVLTDAPIVAVCLLILSRLSKAHLVLGWISILGGAYVCWLGVLSLRTRSVTLGEGDATPHSVRKAFFVNLLNPHVYLFWLTAGSSLVLRAARESLATAVLFVAGFYLMLCGSKIVMAVLIHRSRGFLKGKAYLSTVRLLGVALLGFAGWLIWEGIISFS